MVICLAAAAPGRAAYDVSLALYDPRPISDGYYGWRVAVLGSDFLIATYRNVAYLVDGTSGTVRRRFERPAGYRGVFGYSVAALGSDPIVGGLADRACRFDGVTGALVHCYVAPDRGLAGDALAAVGSDVALCDTSGSGTVYVFDGDSASIRRVLRNPASGTGSDYCRTLAAAGANLLVAGRNSDGGVVHIFDPASGALVRSIPSPDPTSDDGFGDSAAAVGTFIVVGAPAAAQGGVVHVFDAASGSLVRTIANPEAGGLARFGASLAPLGMRVVVGAPGAHDRDGAAYVVDPVSGAIEDVLHVPAGSAGEAGTSVAVAANTIVMSAPLVTDRAEEEGAVHVFPACGDGMRRAGEECDDGNRAAGDGCGADCRVELCPPTPASGCLRSAIGGRSSLALRGRRPHLAWRWRGGKTSAPLDLGDPTATTSYGLCIYQGVTPGLAFDVRATRGGRCGKRNCWRRVGRAGFRYRDAASHPNAIVTIDMRSLRGGRTTIGADLVGRAVDALPRPLEPPITVQLRRSDTIGGCWGAIFETARANDAGGFVARAQ